MDTLDFAAQPQHCGVVMRDAKGDLVCVVCGFVEKASEVEYPHFDGPALPGF